MTSSTPGITARPNSSSRGSNFRRTMSGSMNAISTDMSAMHVAPTDAFESLIEP